jgi:hypothetical protein
MTDDRNDLATASQRLVDQARLLLDAARHGDAVPSDLAAVRLARDAHTAATSALRIAVERARAAGHTWQEIGDLLGVTRQAAFQRFGRPIDTPTGEPMTGTLPDAATRAVVLLTDWFDGRYDQVVPEFDQTVAAQLPPDRLAAAWDQVVGLVGAYESMGEPVVRQIGEHTVVDVPLTFDGGAMTGRVAYDREGRVAGLFVLLPTAA